MNVLHPPIVHFPIALCLFASVTGLLYLYRRPLPALRLLTWWPLLFGWLATGFAMLTGLFDQRYIAPDAPFRAILNWHIGTGLALFVVYGWLLYRRWLFNSAKARRERGRRGVDYADLLDDPSTRWWVEDGSAAIENILIASTALGYGSCWLEGWTLPHEQSFKALLGVPEEKRLLTLIPIGVPVEWPTREKKPLEEVIHWERY